MEDRRKEQIPLSEIPDNYPRETTVRFGLWPILCLIIMSIGYLYLAHSQACDRLTKLETQYSYIYSGIDELKNGTKELASMLREHEKNSRQ